MKTTQVIYDQKQRIYRLAMALGMRNAARAHPETGGMALMVHNWGNEASKEAWARAEARWRRLKPGIERVYDAAEHRHHVAKSFRPTWCEACQSA